MTADIIELKPNKPDLELFSLDLAWLHDELETQATTLAGLSGPQFKKCAIDIVLGIWDLGRTLGAFEQMKTPVTRFDEENHSFTVKWHMERIPAQVEITVSLRRYRGNWQVTTS